MHLRDWDDWLLRAPDGGDGGGDGGTGDGGTPGGDGGGPGDGGTPGGTPGGGTGEAFGATLPADLRAVLETDKIDGLETLTRNYASLQQKIGAKGIVVPGKEAPDADKLKFRQDVAAALGDTLPESADKYELIVPEGQQQTDQLTAFHGFARDLFHKAGLTAGQAKIINEGWNAYAAQQASDTQQAETSASDAALQAVYQEWGAAKEAKLAAGMRAVQQFGAGDATLDKVEKIMGTAETMKLFAAIGEALGDDSAQPTGQGGRAIATPAEAKAEIDRLKKDPDFQKAFGDRTHPEYADAVRRMQRLNELAHKGEQ